MNRIKVVTVTAIIALGLGACATAPEAPTVEVAELSDEAFKALRDPILAQQDAFKKASLPKADQQLTDLLQRQDLTADQRAEVYYNRGFSRGLFVRDYPLAFPQCAVMDYWEMEKLSPNHRLIDKMKDNRQYQYARAKFFVDAPAECVAGAAAYQAELGDCTGLRDEAGQCIINYKY
jgi:hypothetical protein